ncbi:hypothetical protein DPMN_007142 [Dreissena polymorpha]|uniref:Uncharacterized protein n=1 Tax=Dreissena polymorpha TaxID=45954 RepID=A0A9D4MWS4_DREPO|nr:hypothetical protein DPMN_007142 [Dreissena polymorpha]
MNHNAGTPYFGQFGVSSPPFNQFGGANQSYQNNMNPPPWAASLIEDIKNIKQQIAKIDRIEDSVNKITQKVEQLEVKVKCMEASCKFINEQFKETKHKLEKSEDQIKRFNEQSNKIEKCIESFQTKLTQIEDANDNLEFHSLRENLLFHGIKKSPSKHENCEELIKTLIQDVLQIEKNIELDRVHRIGKDTPGKTRPIVAKFHHYSDRESRFKGATPRRWDTADEGYHGKATK